MFPTWAPFTEAGRPAGESPSQLNGAARTAVGEIAGANPNGSDWGWPTWGRG